MAPLLSSNREATNIDIRRHFLVGCFKWQKIFPELEQNCIEVQQRFAWIRSKWAGFTGPGFYNIIKKKEPGFYTLWSRQFCASLLNRPVDWPASRGASGTGYQWGGCCRASLSVEALSLPTTQPSSSNSSHSSHRHRHRTTAQVLTFVVVECGRVSQKDGTFTRNIPQPFNKRT